MNTCDHKATDLSTEAAEQIGAKGLRVSWRHCSNPRPARPSYYCTRHTNPLLVEATIECTSLPLAVDSIHGELNLQKFPPNLVLYQALHSASQKSRGIMDYPFTTQSSELKWTNYLGSAFISSSISN